MNKTMKKLDALLVAVAMAVYVCSFGFVSCGDDDGEGGKVAYDPSKPVVLTSFHPDSGGIASKIIFDGENFGTDPSMIKVYFNQKQAPVIGSSGKRMYAVVPRLPGDTCTISVVVGNDSAVYDHKFRYKVTVSVSTIAGNGTGTFSTDGTLEGTTLKPRFLCVDKDDNLFVTLNEGSAFGMLKINEVENSVVSLALGNSGNVMNPQPPCADKVTGTITSANDNAAGVYYTFDPKEGWGMRIRSWTWKDPTDLPVNTWKKAMAYCQLDSCIYVQHRNGHLVKINPKTRVGEVIYKIGEGDSYGLAFHPHQPNMLYFSYTSGSGVNSHAICCMDINDPEGTFRRLNSSSSPGHRDGDIATAQFNNPYQIYFDEEAYLYIADMNNHCIRRLSPDNIVETVLGIPGQSGSIDGGKDEALFNQPTGLGIASDGSIYVAEWAGNRIRKLSIE
jgi:hypothetical protein